MAARINRSVRISGSAPGAVIITGDGNRIIDPSKPRDVTKAQYKFLSYYDVEDGDIFFGRDAAVKELASLISRHRVVILQGQSGSVVRHR